MNINTYRTLWLSDIHLGCRDCKIDYLLDFFEHNQAETIILVGDIIDLWSQKHRAYWPQSHHAFLNLLIDKAHHGCKVIYIPGNHDEKIRDFLHYDFGHIQLERQYIHTTAIGKKILALHGDEFDDYVTVNRFHSYLGDKGYDFLLFLNRWLHVTRRKMNKPYWSLASYLKHRVDKAHQAIARFRQAAIGHAESQQVDGIICGHIHQPDLRLCKEIMYANCGDWVENCTLLTETHDGMIQLRHWTDTHCHIIADTNDLFKSEKTTLRPPSHDHAA
ncbi:UDP-2,3-diacylglucosamine diphosphatase [Photobacterium leiognathi]|uniref:UDP-2,3-diacylglucosamine diphosphatase n=1 Tax=Photobacterium leiognathi TaxID=553611 RepID=UPI002736C69A|nr:UDP-2,3-diacylglucosamine diphosphatase [Photobacterium leiognathi]